MKKILFLLMITTMVGCLNEPQSTEHTGKDTKFEVEFLFEKDSIKMYRFYDGGRFHYFTTGGETMTEQVVGKTTYEERIKTKYKIGDDEYRMLKAEIINDADKSSKASWK
jgi:hypothetical protein